MATARLIIGIATLAVALTAALTAAPGWTQGEGANVGRIRVSDGGFISRATGEPFVPLGVNYYRGADIADGQFTHATFSRGNYDREFIEGMMADLEAWGMNTVRTFQAFWVGDRGILESATSREIDPIYLDNVEHFLRTASRHGIRVIFTWDIWIASSEWWATTRLPDEDRWDLLPEWDESLGINGFRLCRDQVRVRANSIVALIQAIRERDPALLEVVLAWELENEIYFSAETEPFSLTEGTYDFRGEEYDLSSDEDKQRLMDDVIIQWCNACTAAIREADPEALVTAGVFPFGAIGREGPGNLSNESTPDTRIPARPLALLRADLDYLDIHLYNWVRGDESAAECLERSLASAEWGAVRAGAEARGIPVIVGETGVFVMGLKDPDGSVDHEAAKAVLAEQTALVRQAGFVGALYWPYGNPESEAGDMLPALCLFPAYAEVFTAAWER